MSNTGLIEQLNNELGYTPPFPWMKVSSLMMPLQPTLLNPAG